MNPTLPPEMRDRSAWYGAELAGSTDWVEHLSKAEIGEVDHAVHELEESEVELTAITPKDVPLPTLGPRLQCLLDEVLNGRGFVLIKSLPVERWTKRQAGIAFLVIGLHLGRLRIQNAEGHLLGHVKDLGRSSDDPHTRIYQTRERQTQPYFTIPIFNYHDGLLSAIYQRQYIESARRFPDVASLTALQIEALDLLDELANDPKLNLMMELEPGDIQLVHNHTILHDRTAFEDFSEPERKRHLLRLWLAPPGARSLPEVYAERFGSTTPGDRGGVIVQGSSPTIPFE